MDKESRAARFLDSMELLNDLLAGRAPGLTVDAVGMAQMLSILNDEAKKVVPSYEPGPFVANDYEDDG
jgi:hypothetical protein